VSTRVSAAFEGGTKGDHYGVGAVRSYARFAVIVVWTAVMYLIMVVCNAALARNWPRQLRVQTGLISFWGRVVRWIAGIRMRVQGEPPAPPFIQVSNHLTYIDMVLFWSLQGCAFVSRADLERWPVMGPMSRNLNTIFINREDRRDTHRVNAKLSDAYDRGVGMHIFIEGRISQDAQVAPFNAPLLEPAVAKGVPVHYAALSYKTPDGYPPASEVVVWKQDVSLGRNILNILALPWVEASVTFGAEPLTAPDRKTLAANLRERVIEIFEPLT
jgi:1-acyl-sn-glycerol-3-phosphate acyltransferase